MNISHARRLAVGIAVPALAVSALAAGTTSSYADPTPSGTSASNWLVGELGDDDLIFNDQFEFTDYGLSIDVAFAAAAAGVDANRANDVAAALAPVLDSYITGEDFGDAGSTYAGATAKALVLARLTGNDPTAFGGTNLVTRLESVVDERGRLGDVSTFGDFANSIGQSYAVDGLSGAGSARAADVTAFLLQQQCSAGFFRQGFSPVGAADQSCDGASPAAAPDTDTTAIAILALQSRPNDPAARAAVDRGIAWLKSTQTSTGAFAGDVAGPNANSTGLAATALASRCEIVSADRAADRLRDLQIGSDAPAPLAGDIGAVAYDVAGLTAARGEGITDESRDQFRRATAQAVPGMLVETAGTPSVSFGLTPDFGRVGKPLTLRVRGVAAGETVCFGDVNDFRPIVGAGGITSVTVTQNEAGKNRYRATTGPGLATERINFLDRTRFDVAVTKSQVTRGSNQGVVIRGLERGEKVRVFVQGKRVAKGTANAKGRYFARFTAQGQTGRTRVKVIGQFFNRKGFEPFRLVR